MQWIIVYIIFFVLIAISLIFGNVHKQGILNVIRKYIGRLTTSNISSTELAKMFLEKANMSETQIVEINSKQTNCYNPKFNVIKFSSENFNSLSLLSLAISAKEAAHAKSKHKKYFFALRFIITPIFSIISRLFIPMVLLGSILSYLFNLNTLGFNLIIVTLIIYPVSILIYYFLTLPEKNLSKNAIETLKNENILENREIEIINHILACLDRTYITTYILSILFFLSALDYQKIMTTKQIN